MRAAFLIATLVLALPLRAYGVGIDSADPPKPTETTTTCVDGQIYDEKTKACVVPDKTGLTDDVRFEAVRELAYAGRPEAALNVLAAMTEGDTDRVLTYKGFANRKAGRLEAALAFYAQALAQNPDNILARSYLGQAYVGMNEVALAAAELTQIRARGGAGTWAEVSLAAAMRSGVTTDY